MVKILRLEYYEYKQKNVWFEFVEERLRMSRQNVWFEIEIRNKQTNFLVGISIREDYQYEETIFLVEIRRRQDLGKQNIIQKGKLRKIVNRKMRSHIKKTSK